RCSKRLPPLLRHNHNRVGGTRLQATMRRPFSRGPTPRHGRKARRKKRAARARAGPALVLAMRAHRPTLTPGGHSMTSPQRAFGFTRSPGGGPRRRRGARPALEALERRDVPSFLAPRNFDVGDRPVDLAQADFNGDGVPDLVTANRRQFPVGTPGTVTVLLGNGDGSFRALPPFPAGLGPGAVVAGDFDA